MFGKRQLLEENRLLKEQLRHVRMQLASASSKIKIIQQCIDEKEDLLKMYSSLIGESFELYKRDCKIGETHLNVLMDNVGCTYEREKIKEQLSKVGELIKLYETEYDKALAVEKMLRRTIRESDIYV